MKLHHTLLLTLMLMVCTNTLAQNASVERAAFGVQTGLLGIWGHHEGRLSDQISLRSELGLDTGIWGENFYNNIGFILAPVITMEPRWYYNLNRREQKSKRIDGNSGNFLSLKSSYHPDWFLISNVEGVRIVSDISVVPTWGMRRNIGDHLNYELGIGIGYAYYFAQRAGFFENTEDVVANVHMRIGYRF